jgi:hypothetical protein
MHGPDDRISRRVPGIDRAQRRQTVKSHLTHCSLALTWHLT